MVFLSRIYTRTGDDGTTGLGDGTRVAKHHVRIDAYGTVDEAGAILGKAALHADSDDVLARIRRLQNDLFDVGADLCIPLHENEAKDAALRITPEQVARIEREIDEVNTGLQPLRSFILSGGNALAAELHVARCVVRRAERLMVELAHDEVVNPAALHFMNRASDYLFVLARAANLRTGSEVLWQPGANR